VHVTVKHVRVSDEHVARRLDGVSALRMCMSR
jgi:hypothetical protein